MCFALFAKTTNSVPSLEKVSLFSPIFNIFRYLIYVVYENSFTHEQGQKNKTKKLSEKEVSKILTPFMLLV